MRSLKLASLFAALSLVACGPKVAKIDVVPAKVEIAKKGDMVSLAATPVDAAGKKVENVAVAFTSSDPAVASVDAASGKVTGLKSGDAKITVTFEKITAEVPVVVSIPATITPAPAELKLDLGAKGKVAAKVLDEKGRETKAEVTFESADAKIATVAAGEITAVGAGGAQVFAVAGAIRQPVKVVVVAPAAAAVEADKELEVKAGATAQIKVVAKDAEGKEMANVPFSYAAEDAKVATVDAAGVVTGVAKGKTKVTVTAGDKSATVEVKVKK